MKINYANKSVLSTYVWCGVVMLIDSFRIAKCGIVN